MSALPLMFHQPRAEAVMAVMATPGAGRVMVWNGTGWPVPPGTAVGPDGAPGCVGAAGVRAGLGFLGA